jgi:hypothetical protein
MVKVCRTVTMTPTYPIPSGRRRLKADIVCRLAVRWFDRVLAAQAWIERVAQAVAQEVERQHR